MLNLRNYEGGKYFVGCVWMLYIFGILILILVAASSPLLVQGRYYR